MGVYQSAIWPEVRRKEYRQIEDAYLVRTFGRAAVISQHQKRAGIPRRVKPTVVEMSDPSSLDFRYEWYEVETFN